MDGIIQEYFDENTPERERQRINEAKSTSMFPDSYLRSLDLEKNPQDVIAMRKKVSDAKLNVIMKNALLKRLLRFYPDLDSKILLLCAGYSDRICNAKRERRRIIRRAYEQLYKHPTAVNKRSKQYKSILRALHHVGITEEYIAKRIREGLDAEKLRNFQEDGKWKSEPMADLGERRQMLQEVLKLRDDYPKQGAQTGDIKIEIQEASIQIRPDGWPDGKVRGKLDGEVEEDG